MGFFEATDGYRYPISQIISIAPAGQQDDLHLVELQSGERVNVSVNRVQDLMRRPTHVFAALAGTFVLAHNEELPMSPHKWPVVGWAVTNDGDVYPMTMDGVNDGSGDTVPVLLPTGQVTTFQSTWDNLQRWVEAQEG